MDRLGLARFDSCRAFTLIEIAVTAIILALVMVLAVPTLTDVSGSTSAVSDQAVLYSLGTSALAQAKGASLVLPDQAELLSAVGEFAPGAGPTTLLPDSTATDLNPSLTTGAISADYSDTFSPPAVGIAMITPSGGCAMAVITADAVTTFGWGTGVGAACNGYQAATGGPSQARP